MHSITTVFFLSSFTTFGFSLILGGTEFQKNYYQLHYNRSHSSNEKKKGRWSRLTFLNRNFFHFHQFGSSFTFLILNHEFVISFITFRWFSNFEFDGIFTLQMRGQIVSSNLKQRITR